MQKGKWLSEEALQIAVKRREAKTKERRKDTSIWMQSYKEQQGERRKPFLSEQYKEMQENNRMGKARDLFRKIRDTKGTFHAKMGTIKDRNGMELTEAEDIKKRWQEYTEDLYRKRSS